MAITEITYSDFNNGESGANIRAKLNDLGNDVANFGGGGKFKIKSDGTLSVVVNGWYCKVIKR